MSDNTGLLSLIDSGNEGNRHSILVGKKCAYCMDCGKILLEYKNSKDFYKWLHSFEKQVGDSVK